MERVRANLRVLEMCGEGAAYDAAVKFAAQDLSTVRKVLLGEGSAVAQAEIRRQLFADAARASQLQAQGHTTEDPCGPSVSIVRMLVRTLRVQHFECRKDVEAVCVELQNCASPEEAEVSFTTLFLSELCDGYEIGAHGAIALNCGSVLRAALRHEIVLRRLLCLEKGTKPEPADFERSLFRKFFRYVNLVDFEVASDAFTTFKEMLTRQPEIAAEFMLCHYDAFFAQYSRLLQSAQNYVTRRQSLRILSELLLQRQNFPLMSRFVQSTQHMRTVMQLLKDSSAHIRGEAFHIFKLFVVNPKKPPEVLEILKMNRDKLLAFFETFEIPSGGQDRRDSDARLQEEKKLVMRTIAALQPAAAQGKLGSPQQPAPGATGPAAPAEATAATAPAAPAPGQD